MRQALVTGMAVLVFAAVCFPAAASAEEEVINGGFGLGGGWASSDADGADDNAFILAQYRGNEWEVEFDYLLGDSSGWALHGDYIYKFDREYDSMDSGMYVGVGYTYVSADGDEGHTATQETPDYSSDDTDSGINIELGYDIDASWSIEGRWCMMDNDLLLVSATWNFGEMSGDE